MAGFRRIMNARTFRVRYHPIANNQISARNATKETEMCSRKEKIVPSKPGIISRL